MGLHMRDSVYDCEHASFNRYRPLTEDEMRKRAPSVFAIEAHESRSDRFAAIPTIAVLRGLEKEGFLTVGVKQSRSRDESKREFTKHMVRLRRMDDQTKYAVGDTTCEIILKNANDGSSAYELIAGLFRIRCLNSLVAQTGTADSIHIRHSGNPISEVIEGSYRVLQSARRALDAPANWSQIMLARPQQEAFCESAHMLRFGNAEGYADTPIEPAQLNVCRRDGDQRSDLWTTFNRVQENCLKGGLWARKPNTLDERGRIVRGRAVTTREVKGIDQDLKLNRALWTLAAKMAEMAA